MPADLISFMRWIGLLDAPKAPPKPEPTKPTGVWYKKGEEVPF